MKRILVLLVIVLFFASCSDNERRLSERYLNLKWNKEGKLVFENGNIHSYTHFDPKQNKMVGDSLIPFKIQDSIIIMTRISGKGKTKEINGDYKYIINSDTIHTDTLKFEFRNFNGPKLLLYYLREGKVSIFPEVYNLDKSESQKVKDIKCFDNVRFEIGGLSIGDTINREDFMFSGVSNYNSYSIEEAELKSNKDIDVDIIGDKYILKIIQRKISKYDLDDIIKVISNKLNQEPEHTPTEQQGEYEAEYYSWSKNGVNIHLQRMKYTGNETWRKAYSNDDWNLYYEDLILYNLLVNEFKDESPKSLIIK